LGQREWREGRSSENWDKGYGDNKGQHIKIEAKERELVERANIRRAGCSSGR
jgi:hypothetical protein